MALILLLSVREWLSALFQYLVLKYGTDVVPNLQTVVWLGLPESFVYNLARSFAHKHLCSLSEQWGVGRYMLIQK